MEELIKACEDLSEGKGIRIDALKKYKCPSCGECGEIVSGIGVCENCADAGYWVDPAGGIHDDDDDDPAAMYK